MRPRSPYQSACHSWLMIRVATKITPIHSLILSKGNPIDAFDFSDLHVAVLNLGSPTTFEETLASTSREAVNEFDRTGRTALSWAAELGEFEKIMMLLMKGADPNIADLNGRSSLHWCAHRVDCLTALIDAGVDIDCQEKRLGQTKVMQFIKDSGPHGGVDCLDLLWERGARFDRLDGSGRAPIHRAVEFYRPNVLKWLLKKPIDLEARDAYGLKVLQLFLSCDVGKHSDILEIIMDSQPDYRAKDNHEEGLCHYMARAGSLGHLQVFQRRAGFAILDVDQRSKSSLRLWESVTSEGTTAMELAEWRRDHQAEWSVDTSMDPDPDPEAYFNAFKDWIDSLRAAFVAESLRKTESGSKSGEETIMEQNAETKNDLRQRVPGSFPDG